ncbi:ABC transporter permease [Wenxinia saemankumensis]|uniref:Peptide/nickel transport system permease protein n=1 Tax=Wenxinia saemankumensis TaxID=1447782 RepID=A0A1M6HV37_9RHOB|nr:ABC transporter permease [Wenxinia saemankumensis]SHJ25978.1 peptide/nickel transport system permease protein [Wenxinia saemankumensis]
MSANDTHPPHPAGRKLRVGAGMARYLGAFRSPRGMIGGGLLLVMMFAALLAPVLFPGGVDLQTRDNFQPPTFAHPFGTDEYGRDIFVRCIYALRVSLSLVLVAVPFAMALGILMGLSGAVSRRLGEICQRIFDIILGFPSLVLGICIVVAIGAGWLALAITILVFSLPQFGRLARGALLTEQNREYVLAARVLGVPKRRIMTRHILPNTLDPLLVQASLSMIAGIFAEAALSIVGLGIQPPTPSLGTLLNVGIRYVYAQPMYTAGPIIMLLLLALAFNLIADALNAAVLKAKRA